MYRVVLPSLLETVPTTELPLTVPFTSQVICVPAETQSDAVKDCDRLSATLVVAGETEFATAQRMVTLALEDFDGSATLVAVTFNVDGEGRLAGAA